MAKRKLTTLQRLKRQIRELQEAHNQSETYAWRSRLRAHGIPQDLAKSIFHTWEQSRLERPIILGLADGNIFGCSYCTIDHNDANWDWITLSGNTVKFRPGIPYTEDGTLVGYDVQVRVADIAWFAIKHKPDKPDEP